MKQRAYPAALPQDIMANLPKLNTEEVITFTQAYCGMSVYTYIASQLLAANPTMSAGEILGKTTDLLDALEKEGLV